MMEERGRPGNISAKGEDVPLDHEVETLL